jgi:hypothetical protein
LGSVLTPQAETMNRAAKAAEYEAFVASLVTTISKQFPTSKLGHGSSNRLTGKSGAKHQVDVSFVDLTDSPPTLVVFECKLLGKRIQLSHVKILKATMDDLTSAPGLPRRVMAMFVATKGFCGGQTTKYAKYHGIDIRLIKDLKNYSFPYKDHKVAGTTICESLSISSSSTYQAFKACQNCGKLFDATGNKPLCPECATHETVI